MSDLYDKYYQRIKSLNIKHYGGEVSYYSNAELRPAEKALLKKITKGSKILDIGCGSGRFSINAAKMGFDVLGLDITPEAIEACKLRAKREKTKARFMVHDITDGPPGGQFDYVFCPRFVINAIPTDKYRRKAIESMYRACKPGGAVLIESFNLLYMGKGPQLPLKNLARYVLRKIKLASSSIFNYRYAGLLPGDITYEANKVEGASEGYAHLPAIFEIDSYLKNGRLLSIYEITGRKKKDYFKPFRYSIWTIDENIT